MRGLTRACSQAIHVLALLPKLGEGNPCPVLQKQERFRRVRGATTLEIGRRVMFYEKRDGFARSHSHWCISRNDAA
eukprot:998025-Pleurochrysis_carterae.AAC.1